MTATVVHPSQVISLCPTVPNSLSPPRDIPTQTCHARHPDFSDTNECGEMRSRNARLLAVLLPSSISATDKALRSGRLWGRQKAVTHACFLALFPPYPCLRIKAPRHDHSPLADYSFLPCSLSINTQNVHKAEQLP